MKKILFIAVCCLLFCGCGKDNGIDEEWKSKIQLSELELKNGYFTGHIKNLTDKAYDVTITLELKSGNSKRSGVCMEELKGNETINLKCSINGIDNTYTYKIKEVAVSEKEIPDLEEGEISFESLKYHFEDIYDEHTLTFKGFSIKTLDEGFPYIEKIQYNKDLITIEGSLAIDSHNFSYKEEFNTINSSLASISFFVPTTEDRNFYGDLYEIISEMNPLSKNDDDIVSRIHETLANKNLDPNRCVKAGDWCITVIREDTLDSYFIVKQ